MSLYNDLNFITQRVKFDPPFNNTTTTLTQFVEVFLQVYGNVFALRLKVWLSAQGFLFQLEIRTVQTSQVLPHLVEFSMSLSTFMLWCAAMLEQVGEIFQLLPTFMFRYLWAMLSLLLGPMLFIFEGRKVISSPAKWLTGIFSFWFVFVTSSWFSWGFISPSSNTYIWFSVVPDGLYPEIMLIRAILFQILTGNNIWKFAVLKTC